MNAERTDWQKFHDLEAPEYDQLCFTQNTAAEVEFIIDTMNLSPGASILDVGCGTGRHAIELARSCWSWRRRFESYAVVDADCYVLNVTHRWT